MTDANKPTRCPHCGYTCGKPLQTSWPLPPDVSLRPRPGSPKRASL